MTSKLIESYNTDEAFLYDKTYLFIKGYATGLELNQTLRALPLARKFHNGQYRKGDIVIDGKIYQLPYVLHVLKVCSTLISLHLPLTKEDLDILLASALLHDCLEDSSSFFPHGGSELTTKYKLNPEIYNIVKLLSKQPGASEEQLDIYFNNIKRNKFATLIKLADRSHNVEDLYNMKPDKLHKYVIETRTWIYPLATYGKTNYPELSNGFTILKSKIVSLTECTETIVELYEETIRAKDAQILELQDKLHNI